MYLYIIDSVMDLNDELFQAPTPVNMILSLQNSSKMSWHVWSPSYFPCLTLVVKPFNKVSKLLCLLLHKFNFLGFVLQFLVLRFSHFVLFSKSVAFFWEPVRTDTRIILCCLKGGNSYIPWCFIRVTWFNRLVLLGYVTQLRRKGLGRGRTGFRRRFRQDNKDTMASPLGVR